MAEKKRCTNCKKDRPLKEFWKSNNLEMYPENGKVDLCRSCLTKAIKDYDNYLEVREVCRVMDYPYIEEKWKDVVTKFKATTRFDESNEAKKRESITKAMGDYARQMKLVAYKDKTYADSDEVISLIKNAEEVSLELEEKILEEELELLETQENNSLSAEDRAFLMKKWDTSDLKDILYLEEFYLGMMEDFEIVSTAHKDYLVMIATVSLKLKKALKNDDWEAIKTLRIAYSSWMKEAEFTAQQVNKDKSDFASCFGEIAAFLETRGFIDTIDIEYDRDTVDKTIGNLNSYTRDLVLSENSLGDLLEATIKLMNAPEEDEDADYVYSDEDIWADELEVEWDDEDQEDAVKEDPDKEKEAKSDKDE